MGLKVFGSDPEQQPKPRQRFADDIVGRFRSGQVVNNLPSSLKEWRLTTGDPEVANKVYDILGGDAPQPWKEAKGEENIEVFTASPSVEIILEGTKALRQKMVLWGRNGKLIQSGDGEVIDFPETKRGPDPDADLSFNERKQMAKDGTGPEPQIEVYFRLAEDPDLGIFKFQSGSWSLVRDLAQNDTDAVLETLTAETGKCSATLTLEPVEFVAKNGAMAGKTVSFVKPVLTLGAAL